MQREPYALAVVGAGLAALSALRAGAARQPTVVLEYRDVPGGFLRPALPAPGFEEAWALIQSLDVSAEVRSVNGRTGTAGFRSRRRAALTLDHARTLSTEATVLLRATAVGLLPASAPDAPHILLVRQREGTTQLSARRVLIACGGIELTREHARIPGTRPSGVITPLLAHQLLRRGYLPGRRCVIYGSGRYVAATAEHLARAGAAAVVVPPTGKPAPTVDAAVQVEEPAELSNVTGFPRLRRVELRRDGRAYELEADTLVYAAGMMANTHWLRGSGVAVEEDGAIAVDDHYRTNVPGIYAIGTVISPCLDHTSSLSMGQDVASVLAGEMP